MKGAVLPRRWKNLTAVATVAGVLLAGRLAGRVRRYEIAEHSMAPVLHPADYVIAATRRGLPQRGDIVILPHPAVAEFELVKRVIGLPGERVTLREGRVLINGVILIEPWADGPTLPEGEWHLGNDEIFALGDNRAASTADSRTLGSFRPAAGCWRVAVRYWPPLRIGAIHT